MRTLACDYVGAGNHIRGLRAEQLMEEVLGFGGVAAVGVDGDDHLVGRTQIGFV